MEQPLQTELNSAGFSDVWRPKTEQVWQHSLNLTGILPHLIAIVPKYTTKQENYTLQNIDLRGFQFH